MIGLVLKGQTQQEVEESLAELALLARSAGAEVAGSLVQRRERPDPGFYVGEGKAADIGAWCFDQSVGVVVFDDELSPSQHANLSEATGAKVIDRTQLILDIFARRAHSKEGKLQVELAQLTYLLPLLSGKGTELSRLGGGIGTRGPGETKLETDRRRMRRRIGVLKDEIAGLEERRHLLRDRRTKAELPVVSLVGYTNAGKSTLLNALTGARAFVEDRLFATLDPMTRRLVLPNNQTVLLVDTVGFIRKLPPTVVAAFRATLEEVAEAELLLHVVDASSPLMDEQMEAVSSVLGEIGADGIPQIFVLNKMDLVSNEFERRRALERAGTCVPVSALAGTGLDALRVAIMEALASHVVTMRISVPYEENAVFSLIHRHGQVLHQEHLDSATVATVEVKWSVAGRLARFALPDEPDEGAPADEGGPAGDPR